MAIPQLGRYEILETIGQGAMGAVYKARDPLMDRVVAIKTILAGALTGPLAAEFRERFFREARAAGSLSHPGIVTVYDVGEHEGTPFLVMEYVAGRTLESALAGGESFSLERVYELGQQIAEALDYAHKNGVVHRDIKPANILLTGTPERAKIADFGVAKLGVAQVTVAGRLLGTPSFMAPEHFTGAPVDGRADLFSLGVILYWMATGDKPFTGETITAVSYKIVHTAPIPPRNLNPAIPRGLESALLVCLEKDPAARYQTGQQLAQDLLKLRQGRTALWAMGARFQDPAKTQPLPGSAPVPPRAAAPGDTVAMPPPGAAKPIPAPRTIPAPAATIRARQTEPAPRRRSGVTISVLVVLLAALAAAGAWKHRILLRQKLAPVPAPPVAAANATPVASDAPSKTEAPPPAEPKAVSEAAEAPKEAVVEPEPTPAPQPKKSEPPAAVRPQVHALQLDIQAVSPASLEIQSDDQPLVTRQMSGGSNLSASAENAIWLRTDNAGALRLSLNGYDLPPLGPAGMPKTLRLTSSVLDQLRSGAATNLSQQAPSRPEQVNPTRPSVAHLYIQAKHLPNTLNLVVWLDSRMLFVRPATAQPGGGPVEEEKDVPPGNHTLRVLVARVRMRQELEQQVSGEFQPGLARTLHIRLQREFVEGAKKGLPELVVELE